jgi:hypothetical protein
LPENGRHAIGRQVGKKRAFVQQLVAPPMDSASRLAPILVISGRCLSSSYQKAAYLGHSQVPASFPRFDKKFLMSGESPLCRAYTNQGLGYFVPIHIWLFYDETQRKQVAQMDDYGDGLLENLGGIGLYRVFNVNLDGISFDDEADVKREGEGVLQSNTSIVRKKLNQLIDSDGAFNAKLAEEDWFPSAEAHIFISHSHKDKLKALCVAGWLKQTFGISAFIDSSVWGYGDDLLRQIDDKYCLNAGGATYSYSLRNKSTSHIHAIISIALAKMINSTECVFFLNTPNSIDPSSIIQATQSPWLYHEISMAGMLPEISHRVRPVLEKYDRTVVADSADFVTRFPVNLGKFSELTVHDLIQWQKHREQNPEAYLDRLYKIKSVYSSSGRAS